MANQTEEELSVSLYHEVLEAAAVSADVCPAPVVEFVERDFERAAREAQLQLGPVTPDRLNTMLERHGF